MARKSKQAAKAKAASRRKPTKPSNDTNFDLACNTLSSLQEMETPLLELRGLAYGIWQMSHSIHGEDEKRAFIAMSDVIWDRVKLIDEAWHRGFPQPEAVRLRTP